MLKILAGCKACRIGVGARFIGRLWREVFETFLALPALQRKIVREIIQTFAKAFPAEAEGTGKSAKSKR